MKAVHATKRQTNSRRAPHAKRALRAKPTKAVHHTASRKMTAAAAPGVQKLVKSASVLPDADVARAAGFPTLEPLADPATIRKAVDQYKESFALPTEYSPLGGLGQLIKKNGVVPFTLFTAAAMVSKEIYLIDPGALNFVNSSVVLFSIYLFAHEAIQTKYHEFRDNITVKYQDGLKTGIALYEAGIKHCQATLDKPLIVKEANEAFQEAHDALAEARVRVSEQQHHDAIVTKLNLLQAQELAEAKANADAVRAGALSFLEQHAFTEKVKTEVLNEALSLVGQKTGYSAPEYKALQTVLKDSLAHAQKK